MWGRGAFGEFQLPHRVKSASSLGILDFKVSRGGIAVVQTHNCHLYSWGDNKYGQLGHGDHESRVSPELVRALEGKRVTQFCLGNNFVIALGETLPVNRIMSPRDNKRSKSNKRLHSANPIARHGHNQGFAALNSSLNTTNQQTRRVSRAPAAGSPLRSRSGTNEVPPAYNQATNCSPLRNSLSNERRRVSPPR